MINNHIKSNKHKSSKLRLDKKRVSDVEIVEALERFRFTSTASGKRL